MSPSDFGWYSDETVIAGNQPATAVYTNAAGSIVVRQQAAWDEEHDTTVQIIPDFAVTLVVAILREAKLAHLADRLAEPSAPSRSASSGAARSRAYRARQKLLPPPDRDGRDAQNVTRDGRDVTRDDGSVTPVTQDAFL